MTQTQTVRGEVAKRDQPPKGIEVARKNLQRFDRVLPEHIPAKQFVGSVEAALWADPDLMAGANASPEDLYKALMRCAQLGHVPGSDEFYLTPWSKTVDNRKVPTINGIEGYRGIIERMYRSGAVAAVIVEVVREKDGFTFRLGLDDKPLHEIDWFGADKDRGAMVGVYAYAKLTTGAVSKVVVLNRDKIEAAKKRSRGANAKSSPWQTDEEAMWLKTAARRLEKWVPTSAEYRREQLRAAAEAADAARDPHGFDLGADPDTGEIQDAELVDPAEADEGAKADG